MSIRRDVGACLILAVSAGVAAAEVIHPMDRATARERTHEALLESKLLTPDREAAVDSIWENEVSVQGAVVESLAACDDSIRELLDSAAPGHQEAWSVPAAVRDEKLDPYLRSNLAAHLAGKLVREERFDEALDVLEGTPASEVVDPAEYFFILAVCNYHLSRRDDASTAITLLTQVEGAPERYLAMASMLSASLARLKPDSLDAVAVDMRDVRRRLDLGLTDKKVRDIEENVMQRLNQMIEELEKQQQQQSSSQGGNQLQPSAPAPDSRPMGGTGEGKVDNKKLRPGGNWGNLPPKEREKALQEIGRDLPGHYRDAIEEYFRKLAENPARRNP